SMASRVRGADPLVARDDDIRIEGGDGAAASDPRLARGRVGEGGQHVHLVVDHVTGGDGPQRREVHDRRVLDVALTDVDTRSWWPWRSIESPSNSSACTGTSGISPGNRPRQ